MYYVNTPDFGSDFVLPDEPVDPRKPVVPITRPRIVPTDPPPEISSAPTANNGVLAPLPARPMAMPVDNAAPVAPPVNTPVAPLPPITPMPQDESGGPQTRPRIAGDEDAFRIANQGRYINDPSLRNAPENKPGGFRSFLGLFLNAAGQGAERELESSAHTGRPITWGNFGTALAEGGGAGAVGAFEPKLLADMQHQNEIARLQQHQVQTHQARAQQLDEQGKIAEIGYKNAQRDDLNAQNKPRARAQSELRQLYDKFDEFDPDKNPEFTQQFTDAFGFAPPPKTKGEKWQLVTRPDGTFRVDKTSGTVQRVDGIPDDRTELKIGDQTYKVTQGQAVNYYGQTGRQQTTDDRTQQKDVNEAGALESEAQGYDRQVAQLGQQNADLADQRNRPHFKEVTNEFGVKTKVPMTDSEWLDSPEGRETQRQIRENERQGSELQTKAQTNRQKAQGLNTPLTPRATGAPKTITGNAAARNYLKSIGVPDDKLDAALADYLKTHK